MSNNSDLDKKASEIATMYMEVASISQEIMKITVELISTSDQEMYEKVLNLGHATTCTILDISKKQLSKLKDMQSAISQRPKFRSETSKAN